MPDNEPNGAPAAQPGAAGQQPTNAPMSITDPSQTLAASDATTTPTTTTSTASDPATTPVDPATPQPVANPEAQRAAQEAARYRTELRAAQKRLTELEAAQQAAADAKLSETERLQKRLAEYQQREATDKLATQERILRAEVRAEAIQKGVNPALAARLIDLADVTYDPESGDPQNIGDLLAKALADFGITAAPLGAGQATQTAAQTAGQPQANPAIGGTNPPRQGGPLVVTANQYLDPAFRQQFHQQHGMDLLRAVNTGNVKVV